MWATLKYSLIVLINVFWTVGATTLPACQGNDHNKWSNCRGELQISNGDRYVGDFVDGKFSGFGQLISPNGSTYIGEWLQNVPHGLGKATFSDGRIPAEGVWVDGMFKRPQAVQLRGIDQLPKPTPVEIPVDCKVENNPTIKIAYVTCLQIGGTVQNANNLKCILGRNQPIFLAPDVCIKANGLIVN
ncbi:MAG: hypothetical protein FJ031_14405 [Chloroflexi bacterium]|nr:hypothetical protein [Chloroflexota bacterium]